MPGEALSAIANITYNWSCARPTCTQGAAPAVLMVPRAVHRVTRTSFRARRLLRGDLRDARRLPQAASIWYIHQSIGHGVDTSPSSTTVQR